MHKLTRRQALLAGGGLAALSSACGSPPEAQTPKRAPGDDKLDAVIERALAAAKSAGASYADARIVRRRHERISTREDHVAQIDHVFSYGIGVRVIADGAWGFAASPRLEDAEEMAKRAVGMARADAGVMKRNVWARTFTSAIVCSICGMWQAMHWLPGLPGL